MPLSGGVVFDALKGNGYSFNLVDVTLDSADNSGGNVRAWRVNLTSQASSTVGDMQCVHGYLTTGSSVTLGANAAVYPLSAWLDLPSDITTGSGNVIAGVRAIIDTNGVDLSTLAGGGESALFYGQTWAAASSAIEHGLRVIAGASTTIKNGVSIGGSGTFTQAFDLGDMAQEQLVFNFSTADAQSRHLLLYTGDAATSAAVFAQVSVVAGLGSLYISSVGKLFIRTNNAGVAADWPEFDSTATV